MFFCSPRMLFVKVVRISCMLVLVFGTPALAAGAPTDVPKSSKTLKVWQVVHSGTWGTSTVSACNYGIRIESNTGSILVAKAPSWEVVIFRKGQKKASKISFAKFKTKYPRNFRAENWRGAKRNVKIAGAPAVQYIMPLNRRLDANDGFGHAFQSKLETPYVSNMVMSEAADSFVLPPQVKEIWRLYFEFSHIEKVPLEYCMELGDGSKRYSFQTVSQKFVNIPVFDFDHPKGLEYTAEFMEMIYGQKMEDVADLLMSP